jgi:hypothetical protein
MPSGTPGKLRDLGLHTARTIQNGVPRCGKRTEMAGGDPFRSVASMGKNAS